MEWQPIETAPTDGTEIWAYNGEQARMVYIKLPPEEGGEFWAWADDLLADVDPMPDQPTHWVHLLRPPK